MGKNQVKKRQTARLLTWSESEEGWGCCLHLTSSLVSSLPEIWRQVNCLLSELHIHGNVLHSEERELTCQLWVQEQSHLHPGTAVRQSLCSWGNVPGTAGRGLFPGVKRAGVTSSSMTPDIWGWTLLWHPFLGCLVHKHISLILYVPEVLNTNHWI